MHFVRIEDDYRGTYEIINDTTGEVMDYVTDLKFRAVKERAEELGQSSAEITDYQLRVLRHIVAKVYGDGSSGS